jgi:serine/threonine protein kinase
MDKYTGKKLDGRYEIQELIGVGGMAVVYRAYDTIDDRTVAIKILKDEFLGNEDFIRRFKNESKAIAVLSHPNIVKVFDVSFGDRIQYIVMEYIDGITLKEYIDQQKDIRWKEAVHFTVQILRALQHAHEKGIIHRDIKPQNIMLLQDGTIKVTDFGIARFSKNETRTMTDKAIGSVHYIAPEQARGDITDEKADIYSVGVMLYEMLTGQLPFEADNAVSVAIMQLQADPRPPKDINPAIPEGLEEITLKAMQKDPALRYQSAAEMLMDIEQFRRNPSIKFQYQYFIDEKPTKYMDAINSVRNTPAEVPEYDDEYAYDEEQTAKTKSPAIHILGGVGIAVVLFAIVFGMMALLKSCQSEEIKDVPLPNFVGQKWDDIMEKKENGEYHFNFEKLLDYDKDQEEGVVLKQDPEYTQKNIKETATITLTVNSRAEKVEVPDVKTYEQGLAEEKLKEFGFVPKITLVRDDNTAKGVVISTSPAGGAQADPGSTVEVFVSDGPEENFETEVPKIVGLPLEQAIQELEKAGLKAGTPEERDSDKPKNEVLECNPLPTTKVQQGDTVKLVVSSGKPQEIEHEIFIELPDFDGEVIFQIYDGNTKKVDERIRKYRQFYNYTVRGSSGVTTLNVNIIDPNASSDAHSHYATITIDFDKRNDSNVPEVKTVKDPNFELGAPVSEPPASSQPEASSEPSEPSSSNQRGNG